MAELPILPLKTDALLADTGHLSPEEFGAYCRILFTMWRHNARLPYDQSEFARIAGVTAKKWAAISERVMRPLIILDGVVSQKRLSATWLDVQELRRKRAKAANDRWHGKTLGTKHANGHANALHMQFKSNANQNQTKIESSLSESQSLEPGNQQSNGLAMGITDSLTQNLKDRGWKP